MILIFMTMVSIRILILIVILTVIMISFMIVMMCSPDKDHLHDHCKDSGGLRFMIKMISITVLTFMLIIDR